MSDEAKPRTDVVLTSSPEEIVPEIERKIGEQLPAPFQELPEPVRRATLSIVSHAAISVSQVTWDGNFPPPQMLEEFNKIDPTFGDRIFQMAEGNLAHAQMMDRRSSDYLFRGQAFGFAIAIIAILGSIALIWHGEQIAGGTIGAAILIPLVTIFVKGQVKIASGSSSNEAASTKKETGKRGAKSGRSGRR